MVVRLDELAAKLGLRQAATAALESIGKAATAL